jgi:hypothetical protein
MASRTQREGFLEIDHTASPGLPARVARLMGLSPRETGEGQKLERATLACSHCPGVFLVEPRRTRERYYCRTCDHYICDSCKARTLLPDYVHQTRWDLLNVAINAAAVGRAFDPFKPPTSVSVIVP